MAIVYKGDVGTKIILDAGTNISGSSVFKIKYCKPNSVKGEWTAILEGTDTAYYLTVAGDLDIVGQWAVQLYVKLASWEGHGASAVFTVADPFV